jgi:cell wall-associated NlpC family hydrolase
VTAYNSAYANVIEGLVGLPYKWETQGPDSFDCSGAVIFWIRNSVNPNFPRLTAHQLYTDYSVPTESLSRGSVVFYDYYSTGTIKHVTTVLDDGNMLHPSSSNGLEIRPINYLDNYRTPNRIYYRNLEW